MWQDILYVREIFSFSEQFNTFHESCLKLLNKTLLTNARGISQ